MITKLHDQKSLQITNQYTYVSHFYFHLRYYKLDHIQVQHKMQVNKPFNWYYIFIRRYSFSLRKRRFKNLLHFISQC